MLLVVAESSGSSPGRAGYKMAVAANGELCGSIGGGIMEVKLVEESRHALSEPGAAAPRSAIKQQVHQKNAANASGMICSGRQSIIFRLLTPEYAEMVKTIINALGEEAPCFLTIAPNEIGVVRVSDSSQKDRHTFSKQSEPDFLYSERLGPANELFIIGGGHCALALSELMSKMGFRLSIFDDRPDLNTLDKNDFADEITIIDGYDRIAPHIPNGDDVYVVVMTLGYASDAVVVRELIDHDVKYLGVLGSKAKMATLMKELGEEGFAADKLARIHTPIGIPINSRTPEEIAVSIAAEIISIKNS